MFLFVLGVTHFAFMNSESKTLMGFTNPKCPIEFQLGQFQITPLCNCRGFLISWTESIYLKTQNPPVFKKKFHIL
jgi:hypothetical protein